MTARCAGLPVSSGLDIAAPPRPGGTYADAGRGVFAEPGFTIGMWLAPGRSTRGADASIGAPATWFALIGTMLRDTDREPVNAAPGTAVMPPGWSTFRNRVGCSLQVRSSVRTA